MNDAQYALDQLRDPRKSLPKYAKLVNQETMAIVPYSPFTITHRLQATMLSYMAAPPIDDEGSYKWLVSLGYRQGGKSVSVELAAYALCAYTPGFDHVCMADKKERAEYLHSRIHLTHETWDPDIRSPSIPNRESRQITFETGVGGKMRALTAEGLNEGIGQSVDSFHGSEVPYWIDAGSTMSLIIPSMINRKQSRVVMESTPAPGLGDSVIYFKDIYNDGKRRRGRWISTFFPFWDGKLNVRRYKDEVLTNEELDLMHKYGVLGLKEENLMFRRYIMDTDPELRRNPDLFPVYYPFDDVGCWFTKVGAVIPHSLLNKQLYTAVHEFDEDIGYLEIEAPEPGAIYSIGVDPAGYGMRDHASFQILKVYANEIKQVAVSAKHTDPVSFGIAVEKAGRRYNNAFVAVENNGVGAGVITYLQTVNYPNLLYTSEHKPGFNANGHNNEVFLQYLVDALLGSLVITDLDTLNQMFSYKNDKKVERSAISTLLSGEEAGRGRRARHHWDKVSALIMAVVGSRYVPTRHKPKVNSDGTIVNFADLSYNQIEEYRKTLSKGPKEVDHSYKSTNGSYTMYKPGMKR